MREGSNRLDIRLNPAYVIWITPVSDEKYGLSFDGEATLP